MDLISAKDNTFNDDTDTFFEKLQEQIQKMMDYTSVIRSPIELPYPLPPFKSDDVTSEKLGWIITLDKGEDDEDDENE